VKFTGLIVRVPEAEPLVAAFDFALALAPRIAQRGPLRLRCRAVELLENRGDRWHVVSALALPETACP
jgi:hypothetical protein